MSLTLQEPHWSGAKADILLKSKFDSAAFKGHIDETFDQLLKQLGRVDLLETQKPSQEEPTLGSPLLKTGLAIVMKRIDAPSVRELSNNPRAKYWDPAAPDWNHLNELAAQAGHAKFDPTAITRCAGWCVPALRHLTSSTPSRCASAPPRPACSSTVEPARSTIHRSSCS